jgi:peptidoglycan-associated lipoprotein
MLRHRSRLFFFAAVAALTVCACAPKQVKTAANPTPAAATPAETAPTVPPPTEVTEASLRTGEFVNVEGLEAIHFDYDSSNLKEEALTTLKNNAEYIKSHKDDDFLVAGFCDERGTIEYNLALGQKRAKQVREYYMKLGISGKRIATISYGKESPLCSESTEECWAKNRRGETRARAAKSSDDTTETAPQ